MPREFLGHRIADDAASVSERSQSPTGFINSDVPLLEYMNVIDKQGGRQQVRKNLGSTPQEIRDFLIWAIGDKRPPFPPLTRKILCLKRATIKSSIANTGVSPMRRTGEMKQIEDIEAMLKSDGLQDMDNKEACLVEGSKFQSTPFLPQSVEKPVEKPAEQPVAQAFGGPACQTSVSCDNSAVVALITEIKASLTRIESMAPLGAAIAQPGSIPCTEFTELKEQISNIDAGIQRLSTAPASAPAASLASSVASDPMNLVQSLANNNDRTVSDILSQLDVPSMSEFTEDQIGLVKEKLEALKESKPMFAPQVDILVRRIELLDRDSVNLKPVLDAIRAIPASPSVNAAAAAIEGLKPDRSPIELRNNLTRAKALLENTNDEDPIHTAAVKKIDAVLSGISKRAVGVEGNKNVERLLNELKEAVGSVASLQTLLSDIQARAASGAQQKNLLGELDVVREAVNGLQRSPAELAQLIGKIDSIETLLGKTTDRHLVGSFAQINTKLSDAVSRISGVPTNFNTIVADVVAQIRPLLQSAHVELLEKLQFIKQDTEIIDMKVDALDRLGKNTKQGVSTLHDQLREQREVLQAMRSEISELKGSVNSAHSSGPFVEQINALSENIHSLRSLVDATRCKDLALEPILGVIQSSSNRLSTEIASLQRTNTNNRNSGLIEQKEALRVQIEDLQRSLLESQTLASSATTDLDTTRAALNRAELELSQLRMESPKKNGIISEIQAREKVKNAKAIDLENRIRTLTEEVARIESECTTEREAAEKTLGTLTEEKRILEERIAAKDAELAAASSRITALATDNYSLEDARQERDRLRTHLADLDREESSDQENMAKTRKQLEAVNAKIRGLEISAINVQVKEAAEVEKRELEAKLVECANSKRDIEQSLDALRTELASKQRNFSALSQIREDLDTKVKESSAKLIERNAEYANKLDALNGKHTEEVTGAYQSAVNDMEEEIDALRAQCAESGKQHLVEIKSLKAQLTKSVPVDVLTEKDKQIAELTTRCEKIKEEKDAEIAQLRDEVEKHANCAEELALARSVAQPNVSPLANTAEVPLPMEVLPPSPPSSLPTDPSPPTPPPTPNPSPPSSPTLLPVPSSTYRIKHYTKNDLYRGLNTAMQFYNKGLFDENYMSYIDNLYWGYINPNDDFIDAKREIDRMFNSKFMTVIKREMQKHNDLFNEKEYKQYIEKFFDMLLRFLVPVSPELAAKKSATYTRRYGRSSAPILPAIRWNPTTGPSTPSVERKSKRKTRRLRK